MLINRFRHLVLLGILVPRFGGSTNSTTFPNNSLVRSEREAGINYLIFPQGSNVQLVYCLTMGTYSKPRGMFVIGVTAGLAWELPYRNTVPYRKPAEVYHRRSRRELYRKVELMLRTPPTLGGETDNDNEDDNDKRPPNYTALRRIFDPGNLILCFSSRSQEKDGKACVLKAICKAAKRKREDVGKGSFVEEILHATFTLPGGHYGIDPMTEYERTYHLGENCDEMHAKCPDVF